MSFFSSKRQPEPETQPRIERAITPAPVSHLVPSFETVLGAGSSMEGALKSGANIRLDGSFAGTLEITGNVLIGEAANINADINAKNVSIAGAVRGNVNGKKVHLLRTARVWGDIAATSLTMDEGAFLEGKISMVRPAEVAAPSADNRETALAEPEFMDTLAQEESQDIPAESENSHD